jgi:hypothetical protein
LLKKFATLYGTRMFITFFTKAATGPYPEPVQSNPYHPISSDTDEVVAYRKQVKDLNNVPSAAPMITFKCTYICFAGSRPDGRPVFNQQGL